MHSLGQCLPRVPGLDLHNASNLGFEVNGFDLKQDSRGRARSICKDGTHVTGLEEKTEMLPLPGLLGLKAV